MSTIPEGIRSPTVPPYTPEELAEMAELLLEEDRGLAGSNLHAGDH
ncbi:MAG: hypothetical protein M3434_07695 [Gemmatimonadota bacterium]|jgi:hypothetical protein|nr:hypothetical protein [Gemmatimonadota bacterium]MDQ3522203.1 hypothetical protein [Gemmatimonadota bacterium]